MSPEWLLQYKINTKLLKAEHAYMYFINLNTEDKLTLSIILHEFNGP